MATYHGTAGGDIIRPSGVSFGVSIGGSTLPPQDHVFDFIYGLAGGDWLDGGLGADAMEGGDGSDWYVVDHVGDVVGERDGERGGWDAVEAFISYALSWDLEGLWLRGEEDINATGNARDNTLVGNDGDNVLNGRGGIDSMDGGEGNDTYYVDNIDDGVVDSGTSVGDQVYSKVSFVLPEFIENLTLQGSAAIDATGNDEANILLGNSGDNVLNGKGGADYMDGKGGTDTYYVDDIGDRIKETGVESPGDKVFSTVSFTLGSFVENLVLQRSAAINATGNNDANLLVGNNGANVLSGKGGADRLNGGAGDDVFDFNKVGESNAAVRDQIMSFEFGTSTTGDRIDVSGIDANLSASGNQAFKWGGTETQSKGYLWAENAGGGRTTIKGNIDGDAEAEFHVSVNDGATLASAWIAGDFIL